MEIIFSK